MLTAEVEEEVEVEEDEEEAAEDERITPSTGT